MSRVLYFAYGSNMDPSTMRDRRGIDWSRASAARLAGWRLRIDKPSLLGTGEAMATIVADPDAEVWGVLYDIDGEDYDHLELTEGVLIDHYRRVEVSVETISVDGKPVLESALVLVSDTCDSALRPTTRYKGLLVSGAIAHGLPEAWVSMLRNIEATEEAEEQAAMRPFFDRAMRRQD